MAKHGPHLFLGHFAAVGLSAEVAIVLEKLATVNLVECIAKVSRRDILLVGVHVVLGGHVVTNHLEGTLEHAVVELASGIRKAHNKGLISVVLQHQLPEGASLVDQITLLLELLVGGPRSDSSLSTSSPFLNRALNCV